MGDFFSELGMLLLMFFAGLEINLALFRQKIFRSMVFGVVTTSIPLLLGTLAAHWLGYGLLRRSLWDRCSLPTRCSERPSLRSSA